MAPPRRATIAVVGGGYAGPFAADRAGAKAQNSDVRVVLIDSEDSWRERTRWHQVAAGAATPMADTPAKPASPDLNVTFRPSRSASRRRAAAGC